MIYKTLSIIVPIYNEKNTIQVVLEKLISLELPAAKQIIVVDDGSIDGSTKVLREFQKKSKSKVRVIFHNKNRGKGWAIRTALRRVTGDLTVIQDADLEYDPEDLANMFDIMQRYKLPVLYGSRRLKKNSYHAEWHFYFGGLILNWITNLLYGTNLTDEATCYKMISTELLKSFDLQCQKFEFCPEVTAKISLIGINIEEVPISYQPRTLSQGKKISLRDGWEAIWTLVKLRFV